jgi:hypothetical protein
MFSVFTAASAASVERDEIYAVRTDVGGDLTFSPAPRSAGGCGVVVLTLQLRRS